MQELHVVISCTNRKRASETIFPRLAGIEVSPIARRAERWAAMVAAAPRRYSASSLYAGEYWQVALQLAADVAAQYAGTTSVISAGLGLVDIYDELPMYAATFATGHADSVLRRGEPGHLRRRWWEELTRSAVLDGGAPRRLADLAGPRCSAGVVVCVGRAYVEAVASDLLDLAARLSCPKRLIIFAAGEPIADLAEHWVQVPGALRLSLGGSLASTAARTARAFVGDASPRCVDVEHAREFVEALATNADELPLFDRRRQSDKAVSDWILDHITSKPHVTKTTALRDFRDAEFTYEQHRFGRLFVIVRGARK